jgi:shikimate kinase
LLGTWFVDVDSLIEERFGAPVTEIFLRHGEPVFRAAEAEIVAEILEQRPDPGVVAPGGGWAVQTGALSSVAGRALTVYLETSPEEAASRLDEARDRPLLLETDRAEAMRELLAAREPCYGRCEATIQTDGEEVAGVVATVVELARTRAGW